MDIGTEIVKVPIASVPGYDEVSIRVTRTIDKVICQSLQIEGMSVTDFEGRFGHTSWTNDHIETQTAEQFAERHVYGYLGVA